MKILKIGEKEYVAKMNCGVLKRASKEVNLTVPQVLDSMKELNIEIMEAILFNSISKYNASFDRDILEELSLNEMVGLVVPVMEMLNESLPEPDKKKPRAKKKSI